MVSTRGRYALRVMIDLAENGKNEYIPLKDIASRQQISLKYLERILPYLTKADMIEGAHGKGGGYKLTKAPENYLVGDILRATDEDLAPVACLQSGAKVCGRASECRTLCMWKDFYKIVNDYFDNIKLSDLCNTKTEYDYII